MSKYDFSNIAEAVPYGPGKHTVKFGAWKFDETVNGVPFLQINLEKGDIMCDDGLPFTSFRLYFSQAAAGLSKHTLHLLCDKMGVAYTRERTQNDDTILALGREFAGKEVEIELVPTGEKNDKGNDYLGVHIDGVGDLFIKRRDGEEGQTRASAKLAPRIEDMDMDMDSDIPF